MHAPYDAPYGAPSSDPEATAERVKAVYMLLQQAKRNTKRDAKGRGVAAPPHDPLDVYNTKEHVLARRRHREGAAHMKGHMSHQAQQGAEGVYRSAHGARHGKQQHTDERRSTAHQGTHPDVHQMLGHMEAGHKRTKGAAHAKNYSSLQALQKADFVCKKAHVETRSMRREVGEKGNAAPLHDPPNVYNMREHVAPG